MLDCLPVQVAQSSTFLFVSVNIYLAQKGKSNDENENGGITSEV